MMHSKGLFGKKFMDLEVREADVPPPGPNDAIVKVHACGVCGTDINFLAQWTDEAMPLGHEIAAEVVEVGEAVESVALGDRVIVEDCAMCGVCVHCKNGEPGLCRNMHELEGFPGMGQYMRVRHNNLVKFEGLDDVEACLTEPLAVALNAVLAADIPLNGSVAVLGAGPLGLMAAKVAKLQGAGFVVMTEINTKSPMGRARVERAERLGADMVLDAQAGEVEKAVKAACPQGVDRVIVSAPPESIGDALKIVAYGGAIVFFGLHFGGKSTVRLDVNDLVFNKVSLRPVFAEPAVKFNVALGLLKKKLVPAQEIVTHTFGFEDAKQVFTAIVEGSEPVVKAVMRPNA